MKDTPNKTYKREVAGALLVALMAAHVWGVFNPQAAAAATTLTLPVFAFAGGAFGLDAAFKQRNRQ